MSLLHLDNLVKTGQLKKEPYNEQEYTGLVYFGLARLEDAIKTDLSQESRFLLAYNAAHSFALASLRWHGYRATNRYVVFQALPHTLGVGPEVWRILDVCHNRRNLAEYEGHLEIDERLLRDLIVATQKIFDQVQLLNVVKD